MGGFGRSSLITKNKMKRTIKKVAVLGSGVMGSRIACHFANIGLEVLLLDIVPKKVEVAVLVDRKHKSFPISINYVGLSLATTLSENIDVQIRDVEAMAVYLN